MAPSDLENLEAIEKKRLEEMSLKSINKNVENASLVSVLQEELTSSAQALEKEDSKLEEEVTGSAQASIVDQPSAQPSALEETSKPVENADSENPPLDPSLIEPVGSLELAKPSPARAELVTTRTNTLNVSNHDLEEILANGSNKKIKFDRDDETDPKRIPTKSILKRDDELCKSVFE